jgi:hypothetical protein
MTTRKPINEARKALDSDLDGLTNTANANEKELDRPWIPRTEAKPDLNERIRQATQEALQNMTTPEQRAELERRQMQSVKRLIESFDTLERLREKN